MGCFRGLAGPAEAAGFAAKLIVGGFRCVDAERHSTEPGVGERVDAFGGQRLRPARGQRHSEPPLGTVSDEFDEVAAFHRIPARKDDELSVAEARRGIEQFFPFRRRQFLRVATRIRARPTVIAGQFTRLRYLPDEDERPFVGVDRPRIRRGVSSGHFNRRRSGRPSPRRPVSSPAGSPRPLCVRPA